MCPSAPLSLRYRYRESPKTNCLFYRPSPSSPCDHCQSPESSFRKWLGGRTKRSSVNSFWRERRQTLGCLLGLFRGVPCRIKLTLLDVGRGGRSSFGLSCSLVNLLFDMNKNYNMPRSSSSTKSQNLRVGTQNLESHYELKRRGGVTVWDD